MHELERVLERQVRELASGVLGQLQRPSLDRSAEADVRTLVLIRALKRKVRRCGPSSLGWWLWDGDYGQFLMLFLPVPGEQPSLPEPLLPSNQQSCLQGSMLSPGMPVA